MKAGAVAVGVVLVVLACWWLMKVCKGDADDNKGDESDCMSLTIITLDFHLELVICFLSVSIAIGLGVLN